MSTELVCIPLPATGHLASTVQLAKLLVTRDEELSIRILIFKLHVDNNAYSYIQSLRAESTRGIDFVELPDPQEEADSAAKPGNPFTLLSRLIESQKPLVKAYAEQLMESGSSRLVGFIVDMFCTAMIDVANELELPTYIYYSSGASIIGNRHLILRLVEDNHDITQYRDSEIEFSIPTYMNPVPAKLWPSAYFDENRDALVKHTKRLTTEAKGIMVNTFLELESYGIKALNSIPRMPTIYPVGPLINLNGIRNGQQDTDVIVGWLDDQPTASVIFLCFGSLGSLEGEQVMEIAHAIECSGCRFLWSLRRPPPKERQEYPGEYEDHAEVLPKGFLERISGVGKVIGWAPQTQVLAHPAVGGFVTHCGWNSVLESVWFGVPMAAWPMYAEQQMNAFLLVKELGIAAEIKMDYERETSSGTEVLVKAHEIEDGIRKLTQPESQIRRKVKELMEKARTALLDEGSSYVSLGGLIEEFHGYPLKAGMEQTPN